MIAISVGVGALSGLGGIYISWYADISSGATVVLFSTALFVLALVYSSWRGRIVSLSGTH